jgi:hypothetical protein
MKRKKILHFAILTLLIVCSCTIQKRAYRGGYYIAWNKNVEKPDKGNNSGGGLSKSKKMDLAQLNLKPKEKINLSVQLLASIKTIIPKAVFTSTKTYLDNCDTIIFKSGKMVAAKVIEITGTEVKYKYCNNQDGPLFVNSKSELSQINFASGQKEIFEDQAVQPPRTVKQNIDSISQSEKERKKNNLNTWFLMFLVGLIVTIVLILYLSTSGGSAGASAGTGCLVILGIFVAGLFTIVALVGTLITFFIWLAA